MDAACVRMEQFWQGIDVGRFEFGKVPIPEYLERKVMMEGELFQNLDIGGISCLRLFNYGQFQFFKEDLS